MSSNSIGLKWPDITEMSMTYARRRRVDGPACMESHDEYEDQWLPAYSDPASFDLHVEFVRAHGLPKGQYTMLYNGAMLSERALRPRDCE